MSPSSAHQRIECHVVSGTEGIQKILHFRQHVLLHLLPGLLLGLFELPVAIAQLGTAFQPSGQAVCGLDQLGFIGGLQTVVQRGLQ